MGTMHSPYVIHWAPDAEALFHGVLEDLPRKAVPFVRQAGAAAIVSTTRLRRSSEVTVDDVLKGLRLGTPERHLADLQVALGKRGLKA